MAIDQMMLGNLAAEFMEDLEKDKDYGEEASIIASAIIVAVNPGREGEGDFVQYQLGPGTSVDLGLKLLSRGIDALRGEGGE